MKADPYVKLCVTIRHSKVQGFIRCLKAVIGFPVIAWHQADQLLLAADETNMSPTQMKAVADIEDMLKTDAENAEYVRSTELDRIFATAFIIHPDGQEEPLQ